MLAPTRDPESTAAVIDPLLAPTQEDLSSVKVFPLIPALKKDVTVCISTLGLHIFSLFPSSVPDRKQ
jgi:hypothetical protein